MVLLRALRSSGGLTKIDCVLEMSGDHGLARAENAYVMKPENV